MMAMALLADHWLVWPVILPLAAALFSFTGLRRSHSVGLVGAFFTVVAAILLTWKLLRHGGAFYELGGWQPPLGISLRADGPAVLMVLMTAITGFAISIYARGYFQSRIALAGRGQRHRIQQASFWPLWFLLWGGLNGLFLSGDIFNIYVTLEIVALASVGLTALSGKPASQVAAMRYLLASLLGSLSFLLGVGFLYKAHAVLDLTTLQGGLALSPAVMVAMVLISVGLVLKTALFPFHFWLPPAHANALTPVSALLSGLVINGSWYLFFRFWLLFSPFAAPGAAVVATLGGGAIIWGAVQAFSQQRLKMLVAYSTVAQIGYLFILFPLLSVDGSQVVAAVFYFALSHSCAKAAMFLAAGTIFLQLGHDRIRDLAGIRQVLPISSFAFITGGLSLMALPPSGGFVAKYMYLNQAISQDMWLLIMVMVVGSGLTAMYIYRVVAQIMKGGMEEEHGAVLVSTSMEWSALALALVAVLLGFIAPQVLMLLEVTA